MRYTLNNSVRYLSYCALWVLVGSMVAISVLADELPLPPSGKAPTIQAIEKERPASLLFRASDDVPVPVPNHPPIAEVQPMPMPPISAQKSPISGSAGAGVSHNALTGETVTLPQDPSEPASGLSGAQGGGYAGADGGDGTEVTPATFSTMSHITNTADSPWRMNVRLLMRFGSSYYVCSGTMRDASVVLTAGHCVYDFGGYGWADEIWVYPGWDGVDLSGNTINPYGYGYSTYFASLSGWTGSGNTDYDLGAIRLDRAVGQLTGWFAWVWGYDCAWHQSKTYNNASYPSQDCGTTGLHTGRDMYYWYGMVDACPNNQIQLNTTAGCFTAVWGGMSGSGMYYIDGDSRYVHAICSTSNRTTLGYYVRQTEGWVNYTNDTFIPTTRGTTFDLQPLDMNVAPATITAGQSTTTLNHLATNATNNNPASTTYFYSVYLSTNDYISTSDTLLSSQYVTYDFAAMGSVRVNMVQVTIPVNTPAGDYWLGVIYNSATDGNSANNSTIGWDAVPIHVNAASNYLLWTK